MKWWGSGRTDRLPHRASYRGREGRLLLEKATPKGRSHLEGVRDRPRVKERGPSPAFVDSKGPALVSNAA